MIRLPWRRTKADSDDVETRSTTVLSIADPSFQDYFGLGVPNYSGVHVTEHTALAIAAVWRAVNLIAGTLASLGADVTSPTSDGPIRSWATNPGACVGQTAFEFWETLYIHLLLHGNAFGLIMRNQAGAVIGLWLLHPNQVTVERENPREPWKLYRVTHDDGSVVEYGDIELLHIPALCTDGIRGLAPVAIARNSLGTTIAGDRAASKLFSEGAINGGLITPKEGEDLTPEEVDYIKALLHRKIVGWENAASIGVINRRLDFSSWSMSMEDAQFLESRQFGIEEIARWFGVPPHQLMQTDKQTSWGTGVAEQNRGLSRTTLGPWAARVSQRIQMLLAPGRQLVWRFAELERPTPETELEGLLAMRREGVITANEVRERRGLPGRPDGDTLTGTATADNPETDDDDEDLPVAA